MVAVADIPLPLAGQADLPLGMIRSRRWVPTRSKHSHACPGGQYTYGALFSRRLWSCFLSVDVDRSGSIDAHELRK